MLLLYRLLILRTTSHEQRSFEACEVEEGICTQTRLMSAAPQHLSPSQAFKNLNQDKSIVDPTVFKFQSKSRLAVTSFFFGSKESLLTV